MTTENIVQDTEESRIAQQKRETLHSLLYIMAENAPSAEKFMGIDVKALARKVGEAYDQLGNQDCVAATPEALNDNVHSLCGTALGASLKVSKKEYAKMPEAAECADAVNVGSRQSYVTSISFGEIGIIDGDLRMEAQISWSDGSVKEKSVWCGSLATPKDKAERIARERIWAYVTSELMPE